MEEKWYERKFLVHDGILIPAGRPLLDTSNRAFRYGDAVFETVRVNRGRVLFWDRHYTRLITAMSILRMSVPSLPSKEQLHESIKDLVVKNRIFYDARIRHTVFRKGGGLYRPQKLQVSWIIEAEDLGHTGYTFPERGLKVGIYTDFPKNLSPISPFKSCSSIPYVLAGIFCDDNGLDDCLIINDKGKIIESYNSSLFWVKDNAVFTPLVSSGCIDGVYRKAVMDAAAKLGINTTENAGATKDDLTNADEIFLCNVISGIRWVSALDDRRYYAGVAKRLQQEINNICRS